MNRRILVALMLAACGPSSPESPMDSDALGSSSGSVETPTEAIKPDLPAEQEPGPKSEWEKYDLDPEYRVVFVSSERVPATFALDFTCDNCLDADYWCQYLADVAGLLPHIPLKDMDGEDDKFPFFVVPRFRAFVVHEGQPAIERVHHDVGPYALVDGTVVAHSWKSMMNNPLLHPLTLDENGAPISRQIWIGDVDQNCNDWSSDDAANSTLIGNASTVSQWADAGSTSCASELAILCMETYPGEQGWPIVDGKI